MAVESSDSADRRTLRPLSKQEIDRRIEGVQAEVASQFGSGSEEASAARDPDRPRWVAPGQLAHRMRRYLVYN